MAALDAWLVFEDEAGFSMTPPTTRTWSRRGHTPVIRVRGRSRRRLSVAALACYKTGERSRLIHRPCPDIRPDGRKSFSWKDYRDLVETAHQQLGGPIVLAGTISSAPRGATESSGGDRTPPPGGRSRLVKLREVAAWERRWRREAALTKYGTGRHCQTAWVRQAARRRCTRGTVV